jgi:hypothetical protein
MCGCNVNSKQSKNHTKPTLAADSSNCESDMKALTSGHTCLLPELAVAAGGLRVAAGVVHRQGHDQYRAFPAIKWLLLNHEHLFLTNFQLKPKMLISTQFVFKIRYKLLEQYFKRHPTTKFNKTPSAKYILL